MIEDPKRLLEELAAQRASQPRPTRAELILGARWAADHPDVSESYKQTVRALLEEIDLSRQRLRVAIQYAARTKPIGTPWTRNSR